MKKVVAVCLLVILGMIGVCSIQDAAAESLLGAHATACQDRVPVDPGAFLGLSERPECGRPGW